MARENKEDEKKMIEFEKMVEGVFSDTRRLSRIIAQNNTVIKDYIHDNNLEKRTSEVLKKLNTLNKKDKKKYFRDSLGIVSRRRKRATQYNRRRGNPTDDTSSTIPELRDLNENQGTIPLLTQQETENEDIGTGQPEPGENDPENFIQINGKTYNIGRLTEREINEIRYPNEDNTEGELTTSRRVNEPPQRTLPNEPIRPIEQRTELRPIFNDNIFSSFSYRVFGPNSIYTEFYHPQNQMSETGSETIEYKIPTNEEQAQMQLAKERSQTQVRLPLVPLTGNLPQTYIQHVPQSLLEQSRNVQRAYIQPTQIVPFRNENLKRNKKSDMFTKRAPYQFEIIDLTHEVIDVDDDEPLERVNSPERKESILPREDVKKEVKEEINEEIQEGIDLSDDGN